MVNASGRFFLAVNQIHFEEAEVSEDVETEKNDRRVIGHQNLRMLKAHLDEDPEHKALARNSHKLIHEFVRIPG